MRRAGTGGAAGGAKAKVEERESYQGQITENKKQKKIPNGDDVI
jgi:hypothetical protein